MNYIKYLADARLINILHPVGEVHPKKPTKILLHNSNLLYAIYPINVEQQDVMDTFAINSLWKDHKVSQIAHDKHIFIDGKQRARIIDAKRLNKTRLDANTIYFRYNSEVGAGNQIPIWLLGFLY